MCISCISGNIFEGNSNLKSSMSSLYSTRELNLLFEVSILYLGRNSTFLFLASERVILGLKYYINIKFDMIVYSKFVN